MAPKAPRPRKAPKGKKGAAKPAASSSAPPQSAPADAKANGWKPPFPGAKPPFKEPAANPGKKDRGK
jgi:hypothetical protein